MVKVGFIGAGNMGTAIMKGIIGSGKETEIFAFDLCKEKLEELAKAGVKSLESENTVVKECKYIFLAVKPQVIEGVLEKIAPDVNSEKVIVSIAAGISADFIKSKTKADAKVVTVMPNTPLLVGEGATALSKCDETTDEEFAFVCGIFGACGVYAVIPQDKMKEIIAINGSSPAFIYLFAKGFIDYADKEGIDKDVATKLFAKTLVGSAKMITDSGYDIDTLIKMVSSPGGTTLAGLDGFYEGKLLDVVNDACERCTKRAYELSK